MTIRTLTSYIDGAFISAGDQSTFFLNPANATEIAEREGIHRSTISDLLRLALLAPDIVQAAYEGRLPRAVSLEAILRAKVPLDWNEQRRLIASLG